MSEESKKLLRVVGLGGLVLMCINAVVGSGVFLLPAETFKLLGPFSLWAPVLFAIPVIIIMLCFAEAASHFDEPGGAYLYARTAFGDFIGFETGWMNVIARVTSLAALSNGFVVSLARIVPGVGEGVPRTLLIVGTLLAYATIHGLGVRYGAGTIYFFTWAKMLPLIVFIVFALFAWRSNPIPASFAIPEGPVDWGGAAMFMLFAYAGFENLAVPAGEFKNPKRDVPLALIAGTFAIAALYALAQLASLSALPDLGATETPVADAAGIVMGAGGALLVTVGALFSMMGTNLGTMLEASRMIFALGDDQGRSRLIAWVHPRFRTPLVAIGLLTLAAMAAALAGSFAKLATMSAVARLTTYLVTCASVPRLRKISPGFRAPGGLLVPVLGTLFTILLFTRLKREQLIAAAIGLSVGAVLWGLSRLRARGADVRPEGTT